MTRLLELHYDANAAAPAEAWFLPGDNAERWLDELAAAGLAVPETRLFVVPKSLEDPSPAGVLVLPADTNANLRSLIGLRCQLIGSRLFAPMDAKLFPPITDAELRALCPHAVNFSHPQLGLSAFDESAAVPLFALISIPPERGTAWNAARPGVAPLPELSRITLTQPPSLQNLFGGAEQNIGSEPLIDLPETPDEPKDSPIQNSARNLRRMLAEGVSNAMQHVPRTANEQTWLNKVENWAKQQLSGIAQQLEHIRNKELHRLLKMLEDDPEAGLRHAIPMNNFAHRGLAQPGASLGTHTPNFDISQIGGGGAADFWQIPTDLQEMLRRRYREMADREVRLGRFRRAAYIYARLLGDLISAAKVLKQGRHYREAALLYEEHLNNPLEAAHCLAEGGLLEEAIERYAKLERWMDVADLNERLGNRAAADEALRKVVAERIRQEFLLGAAALLDERLKAPDEALAVLLQAWPGSKQASACAIAAFRLLARLGRHDATMEFVNRIASNPASRPAETLLHVLFEAARDYPHQPVRHRAADVSRVLIAQELGRAALPSVEARALMEALNRLAPADRLLVRDTNRFLSRLRVSEANALLRPPIESQQKKLTILRRIELPRQIEWIQMRHDGRAFYVAGVMAKHLVVMRGTFSGSGHQSLTWPCEGRLAKKGLIFEPMTGPTRAIVMNSPKAGPFAEQVFPIGDPFPTDTDSCDVGTPSWLNPGDAAVAFGDDTRWTLHTGGGFVLSCHDLHGTVRQTLAITGDLLEGASRAPESLLLLACIRGNAIVALGNRLVIVDETSAVTRFDLPGHAQSLAVSIPNNRAAVAVMMDHGACMHWIGNANPIELDRDVPNPVGAFLPAGAFALLSNQRSMILEVDSVGVRKLTHIALPLDPIAVTSTGERGQFATLSGHEVVIHTIET